MAMSPRVSVIMAALNCEDYVEEAIDSIINQSFHDWELLISDDGSTDNTRKIIDNFADPRIVCFHNDKNLGLVATWNKLLEHCRGELIAWQDADDISLPTRLEKTVSVFDDNPTIMLCGCNSIRRYPFSGEIVCTSHPLTHQEIKRHINDNRFPFTGPTRIIRREVLIKVKGFRPFFHNLGGEDIDFVLRLLEHFWGANIPDALYYYRYTRNSNSRRLAEESNYLKLYSQEAAFFLANQRKLNHGLDGLMAGGDKEALEEYVNSLRQRYFQDRSVAYRRACTTKIHNQDYVFALADAIRAVASNPTVPANYGLFVRLFGNIIKRLPRRIKRNIRLMPPTVATD